MTEKTSLRVAIPVTAAQLAVIARQVPAGFFAPATGNHYDGTFLQLRPEDAATVNAMDINALPPALAADDKIAELRAACEAQILTGFTSSALGTARQYPGDVVSQRNLLAAVAASTLPGLPANWTTAFWCADNGAWSLAAHTAAQIQKVLLDGQEATAAAIGKLNTLSTAVRATSTPAAIAATSWA